MGLEIVVNQYEIVLATFNGADFLQHQLNSIANQSLLPSKIIVSDDRSTDLTLEILDKWTNEHSISVEILPHHSYNLGCCRNFERLLSYSSANYVMLADQDDCWDSNKAELLVNQLIYYEHIYGACTPLLVHSDLRLIDESGHLISDSFFAFQNLNPYRNDWLSISMQNIVTGCACIVNRSCIDKALPFTDNTILHDWWLALVASRFGKIIYLSSTCLDYRQHSSNVVGAIGFNKNALKRIRQLSSKSFINLWIGPTLCQLYSFQKKYLEPNEAISTQLRLLFSRNPFCRILAASELRLCKHGFYRTMVFYIALLFWRPRF